MTHQNYDVIIAWAKGKIIQHKIRDDWKNPHKNYKNEWFDFPKDSLYAPNFNSCQIEWRIKIDEEICASKQIPPPPKDLSKPEPRYSVEDFNSPIESKSLLWNYDIF
jgi:hypothetical protein